jgi:putative transposase
LAKYSFITEHRSEFPVREMCRILKVTCSGFYAFLNRKPSARAVEEESLKQQVQLIFESHRCLYGSPRVYRELHSLGIGCSEKRVARLMQEMGLKGSVRRRFVCTTDSRHSYPVSPNRLNREYGIEQIAGLDRVWAGDITYIPTAQGWLYLAVVLDLKSRRVIGWSMNQTMKQELVQDALAMAVSRRFGSGRATAELLFHSDRGSQYAAGGFQEQLQGAKMIGSMSRKGNCWDNAPVESFFATLKKELVHQEKYATREQAKASLFRYIEVYYNRMRRHSALGYMTPEQYEKQSLI